jgi:hypothetical protein
MPVAEQFLDFHDVHAGIEQERGGGGAARMRRVDAFHGFLAARKFALAQGIRDIRQIPLQDHPHGPRMHGRRPEFFGMGMQPRPEERPTAEFGPVQVLLDGLGGGVVETDGPALVAFLAQTQGGFFAVLPKIFHCQMTAGRQADAAIKVELDDGPVPETRTNRGLGRARFRF